MFVMSALRECILYMSYNLNMVHDPVRVIALPWNKPGTDLLYSDSY